MSKLHRLTFEQKIPASMDQVWDFISSPVNLKEITPPYMGFEVVSNPDTDKMYAGQIITYKVSPVAGIKMKWITEITHVKEKEYFVDEQRFGPYKLWHHKHFIRSIEGGVEMKDIIDYIIPFGIAGDWLNTLFVEKQLKEIFDYRFNKIEKIFGTYS